MKGYLDKIISEIPSYLNNFITCVLKPTAFVIQNNQSESPTFENSIAYVIHSFIIALLLSFALPEVTNPLQGLPTTDSEIVKLGASALLNLFYLIGGCFIVLWVFKLFNVVAEPKLLITLACFFGGSLIVILVLVGAVSNIAMADPIFAKAWTQASSLSEGFAQQITAQLCSVDIKTGDFSNIENIKSTIPGFADAQEAYSIAQQRTLNRIAACIQLILLIAIFIWLMKGWLVYTDSLGVSKGKSFGVGIISIVAISLVMALISMIETGMLISNIMRACPSA